MEPLGEFVQYWVSGFIDAGPVMDGWLLMATNNLVRGSCVDALELLSTEACIAISVTFSFLSVCFSRQLKPFIHLSLFKSDDVDNALKCTLLEGR